MDTSDQIVPLKHFIKKKSHYLKPFQNSWVFIISTIKNLEKLTDEELMRQVSNGNLDFMRLLYDRYHQWIYNFFIQMIHDKDACEDLMQTTFYKAIKYRKSYKGGKFDSWIFRIARNIGFDFYEQIPVPDRKEYTISYDFLLKTGEGKPILINQKLTSIFLTEMGKIWKALCIVSLSIKQKSGNITIHRNRSNETFKYDLKDSFWKTITKVELSNREKEVIQYSIRGYAINEIAEKLFISPDTVKFHRKKLFEKLDVTNISEAISYASVNKLI